MIAAHPSKISRAPIARAALLSLSSLVLLWPASAQVCGPTVFGNGFEYGDVSDWTQVSAAAEVPATPTVFRIDSLALRDPHVFIDADIFGCLDGTDDIGLPGVDSVNDIIDDFLNLDGDKDGCLDTTTLLAFRQWVATDTGIETVDFRSGQCASATECGPGDAPAGSRSLYSTQDMGTCLEPLAATTSGYSPAVGTPDAPCFSSVIGDASLAFLGDIPLNLLDVQIASMFSAGEPPSNLISGLLFGFLLESEADAFILPADLPVVGGQSLSSLFPGGTGSCAGSDDRDTHNLESGWWLYFNFTASAIDWPYL